MQVGVIGTGEYARSGVAVKNFVRKRPQKGTNEILCPYWLPVEYKLTDEVESKAR
jgi:hypothetical protein